MSQQLALRLCPPPKGKRPLIVRGEVKTLLATDGLNELFLQFNALTSPAAHYVVRRAGQRVAAPCQDYGYALALFNDLRKAD